MTSRRPVPAACAVATVLLSACAGQGVAGGPAAGHFRADGVSVVLAWRPDPARPGERELAATLTPEVPGFHLYGESLPADGVDGIGRPTRLEVGDGISAVGAVTADRAEQLEPLAAGRSVPVYPAGPVTLTVPVRVGPGRPLRAWVSYAACSGDVCLTPVTHQAVDLAPPAA